jgi:threonine/homoserine/homoserine lactone efflux protein
MPDFMPSLTVLAAYTLASFVLAITPGPDMALFLARTVAGGRRLGFAAMFGASTGLIFHSLAAGLGLSAILAASTTAFTVVKVIGAAYLVWLAVQALRHGSGLTIDPARVPRQSVFRTYLTGLGINLTNPKVIMFFVTFLPQFIDINDPHAADKLLFLGLYFLLIGIPTAALIIVCADRFTRFLRSSKRIMRGFDYGFAGIMSAFAVKLLLTQGR